MATEKTLKTRVVLKHDTEENWNKATNFIPKKGKVIIYDPDGTHTYSRQKVGDGIKNINELPFLGATVGTADSSESLFKIQYTAESAIPETPEQGVEYAITDLIGYGDLDANLQEHIDHSTTMNNMGNLDISSRTYPEQQMLLLVYMIQMGIYNKIYILDIILELLQFIQIIKSMEKFTLLKFELHNLFTKNLFKTT